MTTETETEARFTYTVEALESEGKETRSWQSVTREIVPGTEGDREGRETVLAIETRRMGSSSTEHGFGSESYSLSVVAVDPENPTETDLTRDERNVTFHNMDARTRREMESYEWGEYASPSFSTGSVHDAADVAAQAALQQAIYRIVGLA